MNPETVQSFIVHITSELRQKFKRLDQLLVHELADMSRSSLKALFEKSCVLWHADSPFQGKLELKKMPPEGAIIEVLIPPPTPSKAQAQNIPLEILYEDEHLVFLVKPAGLVTHPAPGHPDQTLVNAVLHHCPDLQGIGDERRPGIVHRLDRGTSGVMVVAKTQKCHEGLVNIFSSHELERKYQCLCLGQNFPSSGKLESTIGRHPTFRKKMAVNVRGKQAITYYKLLEQFERVAHMEMTLETGRTHQIRVHLSALLNAPILMDELYARPRAHLRAVPEEVRFKLDDYPYPLLHAKLLALKHPITGEELRFESPAPPLFQECLEIFRREANI